MITANSVCHLQVTISNLYMEFPNGTTFDVMSKTPSLVVCLDLTVPSILTIPTDPHWSTFMDAANMDPALAVQRDTTGIAAGDILYPTKGSNIFDGVLKVEIDNTFIATFPNDLLVTPLAQIEDNGGISYNESYSEIFINPLPYTNDVSQLGKFFLQTVYLNVNYDAGSFSLFNINTTASPSDLIGQGATCPEDLTPTQPTSGESSNSGLPKKKSLSAGPIAGIAVGSALVVGVIATMVVSFVLRRCHNREHTAWPQDQSSENSGMSLMPQQARSQPAYISVEPQELYSVKDPQELCTAKSPQELHGVRDTQELYCAKKPQELQELHELTSEH
ncbi:hypothetical protein LTR15_012961 [Elasticomyces elasticus]|nr:hypothetical protein LTR15_012961 [Elasticomyces elasticus]